MKDFEFLQFKCKLATSKSFKRKYFTIKDNSLFPTFPSAVSVVVASVVVVLVVCEVNTVVSSLTDCSTGVAAIPGEVKTLRQLKGTI